MNIHVSSKKSKMFLACLKGFYYFYCIFERQKKISEFLGNPPLQQEENGGGGEAEREASQRELYMRDGEGTSFL